jgi:hypothetical protein
MSGCRKNGGFENQLSVHLEDTPYFISPDSLFSESRYIPLETTDESIFYEINKIVFQEDSFYILDNKQASILLFDETGKFVKKLMKKGLGPGEYLTIEDFFIKDNFLYILSSAIQKIMVYNKDFDFVKSFSIDGFATNIANQNDLIYVYTNFSSLDYKNIHVIDINTGKIINKFADFQKKQLGVGYSSDGFSINTDSLFVTFPYDYFIYLVAKDNYNRYLKIDFGKEKMFPDKWKDFSDDERTKKIKLLYSDFWDLPIAHISNLYFSERYLFFTFVHKGAEHKFILNRKSSKYITGYLVSSEKFPFSEGNFVSVVDDKIIMYKHPEDILDFIDNYQQKNLKKMFIDTDALNQLKPSDNSVLCIYTFKY